MASSTDLRAKGGIYLERYKNHLRISTSILNKHLDCHSGRALISTFADNHSCERISVKHTSRDLPLHFIIFILGASVITSASLGATPAASVVNHMGANPKFKNIQALRAIAAILVFGVHLNVVESRFTGSEFLGLLSPLGNYGVDLFFVISGFVMITSTWDDFQTPGISFRFLLRRFTRIYPLYWIVLFPILILYLLAPDMVNASQEERPNILASFLLTPQTGYGLLIVSWTLVYELFFYIVFAAILNFKRRFSIPLLYLWGTVTLLISLFAGQQNNVYLHVYAGPLLLEFIFGVSIGYYLKKRAVASVFPILILGIIGLLITDLSSFPFEGRAPLHGTFRFLFAGVPAALILLGICGLEMRYGFVFPEWLQNIGNASYSLYLWHIPMTILAGRLTAHLSVIRSTPGHIVWLVAVSTFVIGASTLLYRLIERPILRFFARLTREVRR